MSGTVLVQMYPQTDCSINGGAVSNRPGSPMKGGYMGNAQPTAKAGDASGSGCPSPEQHQFLRAYGRLCFQTYEVRT